MRANVTMNQQSDPLANEWLDGRTSDTQTPRVSHSDEEDKRLFSDAVAQRVVDRVIGLCGKEGKLSVVVKSDWFGGQRWARNRAFLTSNVRTVDVGIRRASPDGAVCSMGMNQVDDESLRAACAYMEAILARSRRGYWNESSDLALAHPMFAAKGIPIWSDATYHRTAADNAQLVVDITDRAESRGMLSSGFFQTMASRMKIYDRDSWNRESTQTAHATFAQCSSTVRDAKGVGSGWAGASSFDLARLDLRKLGETAFDKCLRSMNPVRIEPGRYQTLLEPQAVASLARTFFNGMRRKDDGELPGGPLWVGWDAGLQRMRSKLGLQIMDRRLTISHDPEDPIIGTFPVPGMHAVDFVKDGVLVNMFTDDTYALVEQNAGEFNLPRKSFVMRGTETTSVEAMISTMKRGLLVTRLSDVQMLVPMSELCTGFTRDGLWLIENGKITKAVRNFRFTESPLFVFNNIESIGEPVPVMVPFESKVLLNEGSLQSVSPSVVVPPLKVNDFSFTSTIDAV